MNIGVFSVAVAGIFLAAFVLVGIKRGWIK